MTFANLCRWIVITGLVPLSKPCCRPPNCQTAGNWLRRFAAEAPGQAGLTATYAYLEFAGFNYSPASIIYNRHLLGAELK